MTDSGAKWPTLSGKQAKALHALLTAGTLTDAAKQSGLGTRTLFRYLKDPVFSERYRAARTEQVKLAVAHLQRIAHKAAAALEKLLDDGYITPSAKASVCKIVLDAALRATELESVEARLTALEQAQEHPHEAHV